MKKNIFLIAILIIGSISATISRAQSPAPNDNQNPPPKEKKNEEIIIRKNGDKDDKMTIEVNGDSITVNGKPLSDYHDGNVTIVKRDSRNRSSNNFLYAPGNRSDFDVLQNDENAAPHPFLGVVTDKSKEGVKIIKVVKESAAEKGGLLTGDIITKLDDKTIASPEDLIAAVKAHKGGDEVKVYYLRDKANKDVKVKLGETKENSRTFIYKNFSPGSQGNNFSYKISPGADINNNFFKFGNNNDKPKLGMKIEDTENNAGAKVISVAEGSPADKAGLKKGDVITTVNGEKVNSVDEIMDKVNDSEDKQSLKIKATRSNTEMNFEVKIPKKLNSADL